MPKATHRGHRDLESEPCEVGSVVGPHILSLGSVPRLHCQHVFPEPAPGKRSHEIMGWGKLAGPRSLMEPRQVHGVEPWAWRLCNLSPSRKAALPTRQRGLIHLSPQTSTKVEPWLMLWHEGWRLDFKKTFLLKRWGGGIRAGGVKIKVPC